MVIGIIDATGHRVDSDRHVVTEARSRRTAGPVLVWKVARERAARQHHSLLARVSLCVQARARAHKQSCPPLCLSIQMRAQRLTGASFAG